MAAAAEPTTVPERFKAFIGGFLGTSYSVELRDGVLVHRTSGRGRPKPIQTTSRPTPAQWREFRDALDELKAWRWRAEYPTNGTMDGTQWSLEITYADRSLNSHGSNSYPEDDATPNGKPEPTRAFRRYLAAVRKLTGGLAFE